jgi:hypothetical protein
MGGGGGIRQSQLHPQWAAVGEGEVHQKYANKFDFNKIQLLSQNNRPGKLDGSERGKFPSAGRKSDSNAPAARTLAHRQ